MFQPFGISIEVYIIVLLLMVVLFFIWKWVLKKLKVQRLSLYSIIASIITAPIVYLIIVLCVIFTMSYYPERNFDREIWLNNREIRYEYSTSLKKDKLLKGKTKEEVKEYLGEPDCVEKNALIYYIGFKPQIIGIDPDWLKISFEKDIVSEVVEYNS